MRRFELTKEQLEQIVRYRQQGLSFSKIGEAMKDSGISRKIAVRAYTEWEKERSVTELETVRAMAGKDEQRIHMDSVTTFATNYANALDLPENLSSSENPAFPDDAGTFIRNLMEDDIVELPWDETNV